MRTEHFFAALLSALEVAHTWRKTMTAPIRLRVLCLAAAISLLGGRQAAAVNLVVNPSFEADGQMLAITCCVTGWTINDVNPPAAVNNIDVITPSFGAHSGLYAVDLVGSSAAGLGAIVSQTISGLSIGVPYELEFYYRNNVTATFRYGVFDAPSSSAGWNTGNTLVGPTGSLTTTSAAWLQLLTTFTATTSSVTLEFQNTGGGLNTNGAKFDTVSLMATCPADCAPPPDGQVDVTDLLALLAQWGMPGGGTCDIDDDGDVDVNDILAMLAAWGACP
jgi:hypothetical protein